MNDSDPDTLMRMAAFEHVQNLMNADNRLTENELRKGFSFKGERFPIVHPRRGIFKPHQMQFLLSIKTVFRKSGSPVWYDDQTEALRQFFESTETTDYAFMKTKGKTNPKAAENRWLREACENGTPVIYFLGAAPSLYLPVLPVFIAGWDENASKARIAYDDPGRKVLAPQKDILARRYGPLRKVKQRLHQASFRAAVIDAYGGRCALSGLPEQQLLDAAHIVPDRDELLGQPAVPNGILLSKIHHAAFDAHLISIDPDYRLHVSDQLLDQNDGPMLEALKSLKNEKIKHLPKREQDRPGRDRLEDHYARFKAIT